MTEQPRPAELMRRAVADAKAARAASAKPPTCIRCGGKEDLRDRGMAPGMTYCRPCRVQMHDEALARAEKAATEREECGFCGAGVLWCERETKATGDRCCDYCDCEDALAARQSALSHTTGATG